MTAFLLTTRLLHASVFTVAGLAKLADRPGSRQAALGFDVPTALATTLAILLPLAELAIAVALVPASTAWWGSVGTLALLLVFVAGISLEGSSNAPCRIFMQHHKMRDLGLGT